MEGQDGFDHVETQVVLHRSFRIGRQDFSVATPCSPTASTSESSTGLLYSG